MPKDDCCVPSDTAETPETPVVTGRPLTRRLALGGLVAMAGSAVAAAVAGPAAAQSDTTGPENSITTSTFPAPTTTVPPRRPTTADIVLLGFAQTLELATVQLYTQAIPTLSTDVQVVAAVFRRHHQTYAEQLDALLGRRGPNVPNATLVSERTPAFGAKTEKAILRAAQDLEGSLAASYTKLLGELKGTNGIALMASIQPIEARQAVVWGQAIGLADEDLMPLLEGDEPDATVFTPSQYPII